MPKKIDQAARLKLFSHQLKDKYEELFLGDEVYVKQWDGAHKRWQVLKYTTESFRKAQAWKESQKRAQREFVRKPMKMAKPKPVGKRQHEKNRKQARNMLDDILGVPHTYPEQTTLDI